MRALVWRGETEKGEDYDVDEIPATHAEAAREWRDRLLETIAEADDEMMELYLEGEEPAVEELQAAIRRATIARQAHPGALRLGVQEQGRPAHARRGRRLPARRRSTSPRSRATRSATRTRSIARQPDEDEPFSALAFKIMTDPHLGKLTYLRVYSGRSTAGTQVLNPHQGAQGADRQDLPDARQQA